MSSPTALVDTELRTPRGDTAVIQIPVVNPDGSARNITGSYLWFTAKWFVNDDDAAAFLRKGSGAGLSGIAITDAVGGIAQLTIDPADTAGLAGEALLVYSVKLREQSGQEWTVAKGAWTVEAVATRAV